MADEEKKGYDLVEVPTQYGLAIQTPSGENINTDMAIVEILNILKSIKESIS